jgi:hypothetical protein
VTPQMMTVAIISLSNIDVLDEQINEAVRQRMKAQGLTYKQALGLESRANPELFYVVMRLRSGQTQEEALRVEDGKLVPFNYRPQPKDVRLEEVVTK